MDAYSQLKYLGYSQSHFWMPYEVKPQLNHSKKVVAYYLPQFHTIPENDLHWGKGFTEWRNVSRSLPIFEGHYQPRYPADLGYYDLTTPGVIEQQAALAKNYGIHGWALYYYWFDSKKLLSKPIEMIYNNPKIDINYCVFWANENWTRNWDGQNSNIIISQNHSAESDIRFIAEVSKYFLEPRYINYQGRPVLMIYRPGLFPNIQETVDRWQNWCSINNIPMPYLIKSEAFGNTPPKEMGFDASAEFPPHKSRSFNESLIQRIAGGFNYYDQQRKFTCFSYESCVNAWSSTQTLSPDQKLFKCVFPDWDNSSRRFNNIDSTIINGSTPALYEKWLSFCLQNAEKNDFVFINAWNEWAESAYLEPDQFLGHAYLDATWRAINLNGS